MKKKSMYAVGVAGAAAAAAVAVIAVVGCNNNVDPDSTEHLEAFLATFGGNGGNTPNVIPPGDGGDGSSSNTGQSDNPGTGPGAGTGTDSSGTGPVKHSVTLIGGRAGSFVEGGNEHEADDVVRIYAGAASGDSVFYMWTSGDVEFGDRSNDATTFTMPAKAVTVTAVFRERVQEPTYYTLTVAVKGASGGDCVNGNPEIFLCAADPYTSDVSSAQYTKGKPIYLRAKGNSGTPIYMFSGEDGKVYENRPGSGNNNDEVWFSMPNHNVTVTVVFVPASNYNNPESIMVEAEYYAESDGGVIVSSSYEPACTYLSYTEVETWNSTSYDVYAPQAGTYAMQFRMSSDIDTGSTFRVYVNGNFIEQSGAVNATFAMVELNARSVVFEEGYNTVRLDFWNPINVDYFLIIPNYPQPCGVYCNWGYSYSCGEINTDPTGEWGGTPTKTCIDAMNQCLEWSFGLYADESSCRAGLYKSSPALPKAPGGALHASHSHGRVTVTYTSAAKISTGVAELIDAADAPVSSAAVRVSGKKVTAILSASAVPSGVYYVRLYARDVRGNEIVERASIGIVK